VISMDWIEFKPESPGPKMLFPMAWSLLPLIGGTILMLIRDGGILPSVLLASALAFSMIGVFIGANMLPGRLDMLHLLPSPFVAFIILMQPPPTIAIALALITWSWDYRNAALLSRSAGTVYRLNWDVAKPLPVLSGAEMFSSKWAARPLLALGDLKVRGIRIGGRTMIEATRKFNFEEE